MADSPGGGSNGSNGLGGRPFLFAAAVCGIFITAGLLVYFFGGFSAGDDAAMPAAVALPASTPLPVPAASKPTLTEFADFNCPYCRQFALLVMPELRRKFIDPGLLHYEYRHMPFLAQSSYDAAERAECARRQGRFREFHDAVYAVEPSGYLTAADLDRAAESAALDLEALGECRRSGEGFRRVEADLALAAEARVRGTPTLLLDGELLTWSVYYELEEIIQAALD